MKIVVVGLGSMGKRRIRLLKKISKEIEITGVDSRADRRQQAESELEIETCEDLRKAIDEKKPDCAVISTSPLSHASIISSCLCAGVNVFTELNLVQDGYEQNIKLAQDKNLVLFLSSTFLYREEIRFIKEKVMECKGKINYSYHVGQYLPDWHPWEKLTEYFVGDKRTNGCRELFAIELPWLINTFGEIKSIKVNSSKNSDLPIDYNDNYLVQIEHTNGNKGMLAVDVISRKPVRNLELFGEDIYLSWNGSPTGLKLYDIQNKEEKEITLYSSVDKQQGYASFVIENAYQAELEAFIDEVNNKTKPLYSFEEDKKVLDLIDDIEGINS